MSTIVIGLALGGAVIAGATGAVIYVLWLRHHAHALVKRPSRSA